MYMNGRANMKSDKNNNTFECFGDSANRMQMEGS